MNAIYEVQVRSGSDEWTRHTTWDNAKDAIDQSGMVHGRIILDGEILDSDQAEAIADAEDGYGDDFADMPDEFLDE